MMKHLLTMIGLLAAMLPATAEDHINLVFIGNSITAGATLSNRTEQAPPIVCGQLVQEATDIATHVYNGGHSGITTYGFLPGSADFAKAVNGAQSLQESNGGKLCFSIMLGTNDSAYSPSDSESRGGPATPARYQANMKAIIDSLLAQFPECKILVNYPIWYSPNTYNSARYLQEGLDRLRSYYPVIDALAKDYDQVYTGDRSAWESFENHPELFTSESGHAGIFHLHPNANGAKRLAAIWARRLLDMILK